MKPQRLSIKFLVLALVAFAMFGTFVGSSISSVIVSRDHLQKNYLTENQFYAQKLADTTDLLFKDMFQNLTTESMDKIFLSSNTDTIQTKLDTLVQSTNYFNSIIFVDETGHLVNAAPDIGKAGVLLNTKGPMEALNKKVPLISEPYYGVIDKLMILISVPVFDDSNKYVGFLGGTIYLHEDNSLKTILGMHPQHKNDSYVFVVDSTGNIIYHPNPQRINDNVIKNEMVREVIKGKRGSQVVTNTEGIEMLAGYASLQSANKWGIVFQTPKRAIDKPSMDVLSRISLITFPFMLFVFFLSFFMLKKIVNPIRDLAAYAKQITEKKTGEAPLIPEKYFELVDLKKTILIAVDYYEKKLDYAEHKSILDPLTGLYNRRALNRKTASLKHYSAILFDIDSFKEVNDVHGHQIGDEVLLFLTDIIKDITRENDSCFRLGGDEFLIILPDTSVEDCKKIAERLRGKLDSIPSPTGDKISISIGIGHYPSMASNFHDLYKVTDDAQYVAKRDGKNKIVIGSKTV